MAISYFFYNYYYCIFIKRSLIAIREYLLNSLMMNKYYSNKQSIDFYKNNRNKVKHLYRSEKKFFIKAAKKSNSFLDLGCALGGFINIIHEIKKKNLII
tara:strand:- start:1021 stop:1317 length:297 start_codon:yes stop_codon:yes gene_type:complete